MTVCSTCLRGNDLDTELQERLFAGFWILWYNFQGVRIPL